MQASVATLLLVTAAVVMVCVVVSYSVTVMEQSLNMETNPQIENIKNLANELLNQTGQMLNGTQPQFQNDTAP